MKIEELPGIPKIWIDFLNGRLAVLPAPLTVSALASHAGAIRDRVARNRDFIRNLSRGEPDGSQRLLQPGSFAVIANLEPGLFGGPVCQILKCLTALRLCEELEAHGVPAVPIGWLGGSPCWSATLVDPDGRICSLALSPCHTLPPGEISRLLLEIGQLGRESYDPEFLEMLAAAFSPGNSLAAACANLFSALLNEWGMIVIDPGSPHHGPAIADALSRLQTRASGMGRIEPLVKKTAGSLAAKGYSEPPPGEAIPVSLLQSSVLPVLAFVADPVEIFPLALALPVMDALLLARPMVWPQASATIGDSKARRTIDRYGLTLHELYLGPDELMRRIGSSFPRHAPGALRELKSFVEARISAVESMFPPEGGFSGPADDCRARIGYQVEKLRTHFESALERKEETARRRFRKTCNWLAPNGRLQQTELSGIQIPLSHSRTGLQSIYKTLDISKFEHQLIWMN